MLPVQINKIFFICLVIFTNGLDYFLLKHVTANKLNPSQECGSGFRARRRAAKKHSIHGSM
jgi:hypothetical protein